MSRHVADNAAPAASERPPTGTEQPGHWRNASATQGIVRSLGRWCRAQWRCGVDLLFPPSCPLCDEELLSEQSAAGFCAACSEELLRPAGSACPRCGMPATSAAASDCGDCRTRKYKFAAVFRLGIYEGSLRDAVLHSKTLAGERTGLSLGKLLAAQQEEKIRAGSFDLITPVPAHWRRRLGRGTSAAANIARSLGGALAIPLADDLLSCRRSIRHQSSLPLKARRGNVRGAFRVTWGYDIRDAKILLADDVMTSGATAQELAGVLREAGASSVAVAVIARAVGPDW